MRGTIDVKVRCLKSSGVRPGVGKGTPRVYAARPINLKKNFSVQLSHGSDLANENMVRMKPNGGAIERKARTEQKITSTSGRPPTRVCADRPHGARHGHT